MGYQHLLGCLASALYLTMGSILILTLACNLLVPTRIRRIIRLHHPNAHSCPCLTVMDAFAVFMTKYLCAKHCHLHHHPSTSSSKGKSKGEFGVGTRHFVSDCCDSSCQGPRRGGCFSCRGEAVGGEHSWHSVIWIPAPHYPPTAQLAFSYNSFYCPLYNTFVNDPRSR